MSVDSLDVVEVQILGASDLQQLRELARELEASLQAFHVAYHSDSACMEQARRGIEFIEDGLRDLLRCESDEQRYNVSQRFLRAESGKIDDLEAQLGRIRGHFAQVAERWKRHSARVEMSDEARCQIEADIEDGITGDDSGALLRAVDALIAADGWGEMCGDVQRLRVLAQYDAAVKNFMGYVNAFASRSQPAVPVVKSGILAVGQLRRGLPLAPSRRSSKTLDITKRAAQLRASEICIGPSEFIVNLRSARV